MGMLFPLFLAFGALGVPPRTGLSEGKLSPCPSSPNCVCSQYPKDSEHAIEPLPMEKDLEHSKQALRKVLTTFPRVRFVKETENYWHLEFKSRLLGFVDDVEFFFDPAAHLIHVRSASRVGHSDFGVNRKRVDAIRKRYLDKK